ncbi:HAD-IA family hydrolase [Streptomyces europaeiscabiei]|uniref:HAD-IA family hydrolase n=1 Tax=Streptomyces europaeiscabiei TaxID=146819 RepID=UPI001428D360|nr:HAD-IA family hydrolase [Streptomyces europaeiscabiei]
MRRGCVREGKPSSEGCLAAAARLGADPARCLVVEDAPAGIAAGCTVNAVASTHRSEELGDRMPVSGLCGRRLTPYCARWAET